jgi:hypothetical protein
MDRQKRIKAKIIKPLTEIVSIRFTSEQLDDIERRAEQAGLSVSDYIRSRMASGVEPGTCVINYGTPPTANHAPMTLIVRESA